MKKKCLLPANVLFVCILLFFISSCQTEEKKVSSVVATGDTVIGESAEQPQTVLAEHFNVMIIERAAFTNLANGKNLILSYFFNSSKQLALTGQQFSNNGKFEGAKITLNYFLPTTIEYTTGVPLSNLFLKQQDLAKIKNLPESVGYLIFNPKLLPDNAGIAYTIYPSTTNVMSGFDVKAFTALFDINPSPPKNYNTGD